MKKSKILNIFLTFTMLMNTFLTPQLTYAISEAISEEKMEETETVSQGHGEDANTVSQEDKGTDPEAADVVQEGTTDGEVDAPVEEKTPDAKVEESTEKATPESDHHAEGEDKGGEESRGPPAKDTFSMGTNAELTGNYLTGVTLVLNPKIDGTGGTVIENEQILNIVPADKDQILLDYEFLIPNEAEAKAGDTLTVPIPRIMQAGQISNIPFSDEDGVPLGTFSVVGEELLITFGDQFHSQDDRNFYIQFSGEFNLALFEESNEVPLEVDLMGNGSFNVIVQPEKEAYEGLDKKIPGKPFVLDNGNIKEVDQNPEYVE